MEIWAEILKERSFSRRLRSSLFSSSIGSSSSTTFFFFPHFSPAFFPTFPFPTHIVLVGCIFETLFGAEDFGGEAFLGVEI